MDVSNGFWVFGYGSLMWRPGFDFVDRRCAVLEGYARAFCLSSIRYRGTEASPGLVLGLDAAPGASCRGVAYRVAPGAAPAALDYLRARELVTNSYSESLREVRLLEPEGTATAICYIINRDHPQYRGGLAEAEQAAIIARAHGPAGPNAEYLFSTAEHLRAVGAPDASIEALSARVAALLGR